MANIPDKAKSAAASGLSGVAKVLRTGADAVGGVATILKPGVDPEQAPDDKPEQAVEAAKEQESGGGTTTAEDVADAIPGEVKERTTADVPEVSHASVPSSHAAEHAAGTVADVVARIPELSTDELRLLHEHESSAKQRKGVLDAIEQALVP
jgi:hypothetical protein